jgi:transcriptional regulator with XRE-family HTH domain
VRLRLAQTPGEQILDYLEALPVVCAAIRHERGLSRRELSRIIPVSDPTLWKFENGQGVTTDTLMTIAEWVGPVTPDEWDRLRHTRYENNMPPEILVDEVTMLLRDDHPPNICRRLNITPGALAKRLRRAGRNDLANRFDPKSSKRMWAEDTVLSA